MNFLGRWIITAIAVALAVWLVPGLHTVGGSDAIYGVIVMALALGLVNSVVKPIVQFLSFPVTVITLGIFLLVINAAMFALASWLSTSVLGMGVVYDDFGSALIGALIVSFVSAIFGANKQED